MNRRGFYLMEFMVLIAALFVVIGALAPVTSRLVRHQRDLAGGIPTGVLLDRACLALRRDGAAGARRVDGGVRAGEHLWTGEGGWLRRDGANRAPGVRVEVENAEGGILVHLHAEGLPTRTLWLRGVQR